MRARFNSGLAGKCARCGIIATVTVCALSGVPAGATGNENVSEPVANVNANAEMAIANANDNLVQAPLAAALDEPVWGLWTRVDAKTHQRVDLNDPDNIETAKHEWDAGVITTAATCTTKGLKTYTCEDCGAIKTETIPALGHDWGKWVRVDGTVHQRTCSHESAHVETARHTWDKGTVTKEATETEPGIKTYVCTDCGATKEEAIPATGNTTHAYTPPASSTPTSPSSSGSGSTSAPAASTPVRNTTSAPASPSTAQPSSNSSQQQQNANQETARAVNVTYSCTAGNEIQWAKGSTSSANFTFKRSEEPSRTVDHFTGFKVDGKDLEETQFEKQPGDGLTLKLLPAYLETLTSGTHIVVASFDDGQPISAKFTVTASASSTPSSSSTTSTPSNTSQQTTSTSQQQPAPAPTTPEPEPEPEPSPVEKGVPVAAAAAVSMVALPLVRKRKKDSGSLF